MPQGKNQIKLTIGENDMCAQRIHSKEYDLTKKKPNVLLIGNGIVYEPGYSWDEIMDRIKKDDVDIEKLRGKKHGEPEETGDYADKTEFKVPYSILGAAIAPLDGTERRDKYIKELTNKPKKDKKDPHEKREKRKLKENEQVNELLRLPFDAILTTNYTYEIEFAQYSAYPDLSNKRKNDLSLFYTDSKSTKKRDGKYLIHTCNKVAPNATPVWHIHGELRRPTSIILSHSEYAHQAHSILSYNDLRGGHYSKFRETCHINSWVDYFLVGNVYTIGLGMDYSEFDLWWLLDRKQQERALGNEDIGGVVFYEAQSEENSYKHAALKYMGVDIQSLGYTKCSGSEEYRAFYKSAIDDIKNRIVK